jgi:hypothetical protein
MHEQEQRLLTDGAGFLVVPESGLEDDQVLRLLAGAHGGLHAVYHQLLPLLEGEEKTLVRLVERDWRRLSAPLRRAALTALEKFASDAEVQLWPAPEQTERIAAGLAGKPPRDLLWELEEIAGLSFICTRLVPWTAQSPAIDNLFKRALEAEDNHMAQIGWLLEVLDEE